MNVSNFHKSSAWAKASKDFKSVKCVDCGKSEDIEAGHILPASRFKMMRLWQSNLVNQCRSCNAKLGAKIRWSLQAIKLLMIYGMIKLTIYLSLAFIILIMGRDLSTWILITTVQRLPIKFNTTYLRLLIRSIFRK